MKVRISSPGKILLNKTFFYHRYMIFNWPCKNQKIALSLNYSRFLIESLLPKVLNWFATMRKQVTVVYSNFMAHSGNIKLFYLNVQKSLEILQLLINTNHIL